MYEYPDGAYIRKRQEASTPEMFKTKKQKPMVKYWKTKEAVSAKVVTTKEGHDVMYMEGEDHPFPGFPRGVLLFGQLSPLKHWIKNKIFNDAWKMLEEKKSDEEIIFYLRNEALPYIYELAAKTKYDMVPLQKMVPPVKELYRALTVVEKKTGSQNVKQIKDILTFILQEDDAYRFRFQWMMKFFKWKFFRRNCVKLLDYGLSLVEHGEMIGDMKERQRLLRRILMFVLKDPSVKKCFELLFKELDWKKVQLSEADKYFFRAKYFKCDYPEEQY